MNELNDIDFLTQKDWVESKVPQIGKEAWVTAYDNFDSEIESGGIYCALIPNEIIEKSLSDYSWDLMKGNGLPGCSVTFDGKNQIVSYHRFGGDDLVEPLVVLREFHGVLPDFLELSEEFRHFHNLFFKQEESVFVKITDDGSEEVVGRIFDRKIESRLREVRQFLAIKEMHLAIFFENTRYSKLEKTIVDSQPKEVIFKENLTHYILYLDSDHRFFSRGETAFSRMLGKKLIAPFPIEKSGVFPYNENEPKEFEHFIIGVDENSDPITYTCNPDELANYFGKNPDAPHYLTPVFFKREVLAKYYSNPDKYSIEDGYLRCAGLWGLRLDNNHSKYIIVYLGDLGRDIFYSEQKYWKSFNIIPDGEISEVQFKKRISS